MKAKRTLIAAVLMVVVIACLGVTAQETRERIAHSNGKGTLRVGDSQFKINAVIVKLIDNHQAELSIVSDITVFQTATWSSNGDSTQEINLQMTGDARGGLEGTGKVILGNDGKSVAR